MVGDVLGQCTCGNGQVLAHAGVRVGFDRSYLVRVAIPFRCLFVRAGERRLTLGCALHYKHIILRLGVFAATGKVFVLQAAKLLSNHFDMCGISIGTRTTLPQAPAVSKSCLALIYLEYMLLSSH